MIELANFGTLTAGRTEKVNHVSNPISSTSREVSTGSIFSQTKDKREYAVENQVAYANPFSFETLFGGSDNSEVSAFDA